MNPLAHDPEMLTEFRDRVERGDWAAARRLGMALELHRLDPQRLFERDETYLCRLAARYAVPFVPRRRQRSRRRGNTPKSPR